MDLQRSVRLVFHAVLFALVCQIGHSAEQGDIHGPLRRHPTNPRYFTDDSGHAILLTGSHTWNNLVEMAPEGSAATFDNEAWLDWMAGYPHNFMRLWTWELLNWNTKGNREKNAQVLAVWPHPWLRSGPGNALDGKPKFDLTRFDEEYFTRLRGRGEAARDHGVYTAVMLFEGWGLQFSPDAWRNHPMNPENNINGINGDLDGDGKGLEVHSGRDERITELQRAYVRKVIDTVNDLDNVLYEISNENHPPSTEWQYAMIRFIKEYEKAKPKRHPVGMTFQYKGGSNQTLLESPADWISPNPDGGYRDNPPPADGTKVIVTDTDHLWGIGGTSTWVWKSFLRGLNPIFMDPYDGSVLSKGFDKSQAEAIRKSMGYALNWSRRVDLAAMTPRPELASTRYCLASPGAEYLVFLPRGDREVTLQLPAGQFGPTWFDTSSGAEQKGQAFSQAAGQCVLKSPFEGDTLLCLRSADGDTACSANGELFHCDFESDDWFQEWGERKMPSRVQLVEADPALGFEPLDGKALRIEIDKDGHYGLSLAYRFQKQVGYEPEEIHFRYYLRFADDWNPRRGGKLPGIGGTYGRAGWGGRPVHGDDGWSARGLFRGREDGRTPIGFYCYHMDMRGNYGSEWRWDREGCGLLANNRWYCVEQYVRLNTPGEPDGVLRGWVDGQLAFEKTDIRFRSTDRLKIENVWVNFYLGGTWTAESEHHAYIDEVVISKTPIGAMQR